MTRCKRLPIHSYVDDATHGEFETYRKALGFDNGSAMLSLLMLRELASPRLTASNTPDRTGPAKRAKVSAYLDSAKAKAFADHAETLGRKASGAGAELIRLEIKERWFEAALLWSPPPK